MLDNQLTNVKLIVLIPVYNHAQTLRDVVLRALKVNDSVMVVDDGSTDGGIDTLAGLDVHIVKHGSNRGKGTYFRSPARQSASTNIRNAIGYAQQHWIGESGT